MGEGRGERGDRSIPTMTRFIDLTASPSESVQPSRRSISLDNIINTNILEEEKKEQKEEKKKEVKTTRKKKKEEEKEGRDT